MEPESFVAKPILFGDFMKMGAQESDRMYEELTDITRVAAVLNDVSMKDCSNILLY